MKKMTFTRGDLKVVAAVLFSSLVYSIGMNGMIKSANLFPGGYSGLSLLLSNCANVFLNIPLSFSVIYFTLNILTTVFIWKRIGHKFVLYSLMWFTLTSLFTAVIPVLHVTDDMLLLSVFGGLINGFAIGIALRNNASSGGTDFIAIYLSMRYNMPTWNYILCGNAVVLFIAGLLFGWDKALYSIIFQFVSTQVVSTMHQRYKITALQVVTNLPEEVSNAVFHTCRHGITKIPVEGGYTDKPHWLLLINISTYQLKNVVDAIKSADEHAFISISAVERVIGNYYQKPLE